MSDPPVDNYPLDKPLTFSKGDTIKMDCQWNNTTAQPLAFPDEMCVFFSYSLTPGDAHCVDGGWQRSAPALLGPDGGTAPAN
jgi:hypothetical protein